MTSPAVKVAKIGATAVVAAAAITAGVTYVASNNDQASTSTTTSQTAYSHGSNINGTMCGVNVTTNAKVYCGSNPAVPIPAPTGVADQVVADKIVNNRIKPAGHGPWAFMVLFDENIGLYVRTGNGPKGQRVGLLPHGQIMYVTCKITNGWDPDPSRSVGGLWYLVNWPTSVPQATPPPGSSGPEYPAQYWAFGGYLRPVGHNGAVPNCS